MEIALINNNSLILGPIGCNVHMINSDLEDLEVEERIAPSSFSQLPIHFSDGVTHLLPIEQEIPPYDPRYQNVGNLSWEIIKDENDIPIKVLFTYPIADKTLDQIKGEYKVGVKPERQRKENTTITITINDNPITVSTSRDNRLSLVSKLMSSDGPYNFKFDDGTWLDIQKTDLQNILVEIDKVVQAAFDWEFAKLAEIDACETKEEVYAVEIIPPLQTPKLG